MLSTKNYSNNSSSEHHLLRLSNFATFDTDRIIEIVYKDNIVIGINILPTFENEEKCFVDYVCLMQRAVKNAMDWSQTEHLSSALSILPEKYMTIKIIKK